MNFELLDKFYPLIEFISQCKSIYNKNIKQENLFSTSIKEAIENSPEKKKVLNKME